MQGWRIAGGLNGLLAVVMGAVSAHALADPAATAWVERASLYQMLHALLLLWLSGQMGRYAKAARWLVLAGIVLFCGGLYAKALLGVPAATAPFGGLCLMAGWLMVALDGFRRGL